MKSGQTKNRKLITLPGIVLMLSSMVISANSFGQEVVFPIVRKAPTSSHKKINPHARTKAASLELPFWDDFSFTPVDEPNDTTSNYPLDSLWENSNSTWINSAAGINAPSINVATFDGVDSIGRSYSDTQTNGFRDKLVSRPIDLDGKSNVYFSFFFQWRGNGEAPDQADFLQLEFLSKGAVDTAWIPVITIYPEAWMKRDVFYDTIIKVEDVIDEDLRYLYDGFQFRFTNYGRESGPYDTWNVDYVYLNAGRSLTNTTYLDVAAASTMSPLFGRYYAVPIDIFFKKKSISNISFEARSLQDVEESRNFSLFGKFDNYVGGVLTSTDALIETVNTGAIAPGQNKIVSTTTVADTSSLVLFNPSADSIIIRYAASLQGDDTAPIDYTTNNTVRKTFRLQNYYAYDDGSAEYSAALAVAGNRIAIAFDIASDGFEKLAGIDIYCPPFGLAQINVTDFYVYQDDNGKPSTSDFYKISARAVQIGGLNEFYRIPIAASENVFVRDRFYIGWTAPAGGMFHVGVDYSNDMSDKTFLKENSQSGWTAGGNVHGAYMIRPLFGEGLGPPTGIEDELAGVSMYPNPSSGDFWIEGRANVVSVIDMKGQRVPFDVAAESDRQKISLRTSVPGIYLVRLQQGRTSGVRKIQVH